MPRRSIVVDMLAAPACRALTALGTNLRLARKRRAKRSRHSPNACRCPCRRFRRWRGDPTVSIGVYASALWLIGRVQFLASIADLATDETALMLELHNLAGKKSGK